MKPFAAGLALLLFSVPARSQNPSTLPDRETFRSAFENVPCDNDGRRDAVRSLFRSHGAPPDSIVIESLPGADNVIVSEPGQTDEIVVIGAHYDKTRAGCGAIDNWTGVVILAHLYGTIAERDPTKSVLFVAFDAEEEGLVGSRAMADAIPGPERDRHCAMINLDSFGLGPPHILRNLSTPPLVWTAEEVLESLDLSAVELEFPRTNSDSTAFIARGIPAVTLSGLSGAWRQVLHTSGDQAPRIIPDSVYFGYRLALELWERIDQAPCSRFR